MYRSMDNHAEATKALRTLVSFALRNKLIEDEDASYSLNRLLFVMCLDAPANNVPLPVTVPDTATALLETLCNIAIDEGILEDSGESCDLFSARLMGCVTPSPYETRTRFHALAHDAPAAATSWFYNMCRACDYIKVDRIAKNERFFADTAAGRLEITINLSKPEKDPRDIARARSMPQAGYPTCMLCRENPGYAGRIGFPARQNHRIIPMTLSGKKWYMQYSPYLYYSEHCIVFNGEHTPMRLTRGSFERLFEFVSAYPHYFLGSNADLPIVGGSILNHDHFQGGNYRFPMDDAPDRIRLTSPVPGVTASIIDWPMSCLRLRGDDPEQLIELGNACLEAWRDWSDPACDILARTKDPHNTVTPIVRFENGAWKLDIVLRNNRTSEQYPDGIFHPHPELHNIKFENIGLIEVMGLFILPGRLKTELCGLEDYLTGERPLVKADPADPLAKHFDWISALASETGTSLTHEEARRAILKKVGDTCARVLVDAGVYKNDEKGMQGMLRFLSTIGYNKA